MIEKIITFIITFTIGANNIIFSPSVLEGNCEKDGCMMNCTKNDGSPSFYMACFEPYKNVWSCTRCNYKSGSRTCVTSTTFSMKCPI